MVTYKFHSSLPPTAHVTAMDTARKKFRADIQKSYRAKGYDTPLLRRDTKNKDAFASFGGLHDYTFRFFHKKAKITIDVLLENVKPETPTYVIKVDRRFSRMATFSTPLLGLLIIVGWIFGSDSVLSGMSDVLGNSIRLGVIILVLGFVVFSVTRGRAKKFKKASAKTDGESETLGDEMAHALASLLVEHVNQKQDGLGITGANLEIPPEPATGTELVHEDDLDDLDDSEFDPDDDGDALVYDIECPSCDTTLEVEGQEGELEIECPICGTEFDVEF